MLEKGWIGGGNTGRNTTIIRSNYLFDESAALYDHALKLWEGLSQALNYNVMFSPRGVMMLAHTVHDMQVFKRHVHANRANGVDNEWLDAGGGQGVLPAAAISRTTSAIRCSAPRCSAAAAPRGTMRSPGAMRAPPTRSASTSSRTARSPASAATRAARSRRSRRPAASFAPRKVGVAAAGHTSVIMKMAGVRLPLESYPLQALVSEPVKPVFPCVVMSNTIHAYISQSDKGELVIGAGTDAYTSYTQRGGLHINTPHAGGDLRAVPACSAACACCATGAASSTSRRTARPSSPRRRCRACTSIAAGAPAASRRRPARRIVFAWTIARDEPHPINAPFTIERFRDGYLIDEAAAAAVAH